MTRRALMLVSDLADEQLRDDVARKARPCPEYLHLERSLGVELLDWSRLRYRVRQRSTTASLLHAASAARRVAEFDVVFSDGEHVGVPLALMLQAARTRTPHVVLAHHLTTSAKRQLWRVPWLRSGIDRLLLHSRHQMEIAERELGFRADQLRLLPYFADSGFWSPIAETAEDPIVVSAGREHRDYATLAAAAAGLPFDVEVAVGSAFSPHARWRPPETWPDNFTLRPNIGRVALRELYGRASVVVVPLLATDFQAGVTTVLEAMAMGKPVVVSATRSQIDVIEDRKTGILVPPGDDAALRGVLTALMDDAGWRRSLGRAARRAAETEFSLETYCSRIASHLDEVVQSRAALAVA